MAHGACDNCGCAFEEHECEGEPSPRRAQKRKTVMAVVMSKDDWVRVRRGHRLEGAAGHVKHIDRSVKPALARIRQLNGNEIRLPLGLLEFVSYAGTEPDVL